MAQVKCLSVILMLSVVLLVSLPSSEAWPQWIGNCWDTWSRCTRWSSGATGILWQSCRQRCQCLGHAGGNCRITRSNCPLTNKAWQCQCYGSRSGPRPRWCGF